MTKIVRIGLTAAVTITGICLAVLHFGPAGNQLAAELSKGLAGVFVSLIVLGVAEQSNERAKKSERIAEAAERRHRGRL